MNCGRTIVADFRVSNSEFRRFLSESLEVASTYHREFPQLRAHNTGKSVAFVMKGDRATRMETFV